MDVVGARPRRSEYVPCWKVSHMCSETDSSLMSCLLNQPQNQNGNNHDPEHRTEQDQCRQKLTNPVENRGTKS